MLISKIVFFSTTVNRFRILRLVAHSPTLRTIIQRPPFEVYVENGHSPHMMSVVMIFVSVCTLKQNIGGMKRGFTNTKSKRNILFQTRDALQYITIWRHCMFRNVGKWVTQCAYVNIRSAACFLGIPSAYLNDVVHSVKSRLFKK